ncbi:MAG: helix-turn-helix domain-containing protein [Eubacteriales bacterium]|nr:helix-turn-helix domain-containing protein [Eubacteriales bacterium]
MASRISDIFKTEEAVLLLWLSDHQSKTRDGPVIKFSQNELADELQRSPTTVNKWMQALCKADCIESKKKGNYCMTHKGQKVVAAIRKIEIILADDQ